MSERGAHDGDEAWIAKYRAALQQPSGEQGKFAKLRKAAINACKAIATYRAKVLGPPAKAHDEAHPPGVKTDIKKSGRGVVRKAG
jgi:hypothetical protein